MMEHYAMEEQAKHLQTMLSSAEIEINGIIKPANLTSTREGTKVRFFIDIPAEEIGTITRRIIKNAADIVCWSDPPGSFSLIKPNSELRIEIPIMITWKEG